MEVNSLHHQAVDQAAPGTRAVAWAEDDTVEAIEVPGSPHIVAVQWHPELLEDWPEQQGLFRQLVRHAAERAELSTGTEHRGDDQRGGVCYYLRRRNSHLSLSLEVGVLMATTELDLGRYKLGWHDVEDYVFKPKKGLNADIVNEMSWMKGEPDWMRQFRLRALKIFERKPMAPWFAVNMPDLDFQDIFYYIKPTEQQVSSWDQLPDSVKETYEKLGIPEAERKYLAGVTAQYESEVVYHKNREDLEAQGVLFMDMDSALREHPEILKEYFGSIIPPGDNKFAALNSAKEYQQKQQ